MFEIMIMKISHVGKAPHKTTASLPAVKPGTHSVAMAKLQGGNAPVDNEAHVMILMISQAIMI